MKLIITFLSFFIFNISNAQNWMQSQILDRKFNQAVSNYNSGKFIVSEIREAEVMGNFSFNGMREADVIGNFTFI